MKDIVLLADPTEAFQVSSSTKAFKEFHKFRKVVLQAHAGFNMNEHDVWTYSWGLPCYFKKYTTSILSILKPLPFLGGSGGKVLLAPRK